MNRYRILVKGIVQKDDKFLAVEKWYDDNIIDPYQWEFVDGETEFGESPDAAVLRIIQEQTGLIAVVDRILYTWTFMIGSTIRECLRIYSRQTYIKRWHLPDYRQVLSVCMGVCKTYTGQPMKRRRIDENTDMWGTNY